MRVTLTAITEAQASPAQNTSLRVHRCPTHWVMVTQHNSASDMLASEEQAGSTIIDVLGLGTGFNANLSISAAAGSIVDFSGPLNLGTGSLSVTAGNIQVESPIATKGGTIELIATEQIIVAPGGALSTAAASIGLTAPQITEQGIITDSDGGTVLLDAGADVAVTYRTNEAGAQKVADEIRSLGRQAFVTQLDLASDASIRAVGPAARDALGRLDVWINNAGADILTGPGGALSATM